MGFMYDASGSISSIKLFNIIDDIDCEILIIEIDFSILA